VQDVDSCVRPCCCVVVHAAPFPDRGPQPGERNGLALECRHQDEGQHVSGAEDDHEPAENAERFLGKDAQIEEEDGDLH